jgi:predicted nucleic acid-binding protein
MKAVCDMGPLQYLVLIECDHILPRIFDRVITARVVIDKEMSDPKAPEPVRRWAASPPTWLEIKEPAHILDIPSLGKKGVRGDGDRAIISLAREEQAEVVVMDDRKARKEFRKQFKDVEPQHRPQLLWMLEVLDVAAERGFVKDLAERLDYLEHKTAFYVGPECRRAMDAMKQRDLERKLAQEQKRAVREQVAPETPSQQKDPSRKRQRQQSRKRDRGFGMEM